VMQLLPSWSLGRGIGMKLSPPRPLSDLSLEQAESRSARPKPARLVDLFITGSACILLPHMQGIPGYYDNITPLHTVYHRLA
jgi:hypothetical protein